MAGVYFGAAKLGLLVAVPHPNVTAVWAPSGIALAAILLYGWRLLPGVALGAFAANASTAVSLLTAAGIAAGNTLEAFLGAFLLQRLGGFRCAFTRFGHVLGLFGLAAMGSTTVAATIGTLSLWAGGSLSWGEHGWVWMTWWVGDALGIIIVTPLILVWADRSYANLSGRWLGEALMLLFALAIVNAIVFHGGHIGADFDYALTYLLITALLWIALRLSQREAVTAAFIVSALAIWGTTHGIGPFAPNSPIARLVLLDGFLAMVAFMTLVSSVASLQRKQAEEALRRAHTELEARVEERTTELAGVNEKLRADIIEREQIERALRQSEQRLQALANYDALTDLPNRVLFMERLNHALARAHRSKQEIAVLFLDLDGFKHVNDSLGHDIGDLLLKAVAKELLACVRDSDTVARLGGDEFALILEDVARAGSAHRVAQKILRTLTRPMKVAGHELFSTTSIGISLYPRDGDNAPGLLKCADAAMYLAKKNGNSYRHYSPALGAKLSRRLALERELRRALMRDEFVLHYQPQVEVASGQIDAVEALIRWRRPGSNRLVLPLEFIPLAEETGLIIPIGEWVLHAACAQMQAWRTLGLASARVAVNVSARQFEWENMGKVIEDVLRETSLDYSCLELELTESILQSAEAERTLAALKKTGISIAVDDFGAGYSSLRYLQRFAVQKLKIDRSFMHKVPKHPDNTAITTAIIAMARSLNLRVTAEGVETGEQLAFLRTSQCDAAQGYLLSTPAPAEDLTKLFAAKERLVSLPHVRV